MSEYATSDDVKACLYTLEQAFKRNLDEVSAERDALNVELQEAHVDCIRLQQEINCLRMDPCQLPHCVKERDRYKSLCAKLAGALGLSRTILNSISNELKSDFNLAHDNMAENACYIASKCEEALADYEKAGRKLQ